MSVRDPGRRGFIVAATTFVGLALAGGMGWVVSRLGAGNGETVAGVSSTTTDPTNPPTPATPTSTAAPTTTTTGPAPTTSQTATTDQTTTTTTEPPETTTSTSPPVLEGDIAAICVAAWGGARAQGEFEQHVIERLTIHHTASRLDDNTRAPHHVRGHQRFHQRDRGWPDLAYHFIVDRNGYVYQGRPLWARGDTGTTYDPSGHFLVCCEGNFDEQKPSALQVESLVRVLAWASAEFRVAPGTMRGHHDWAKTSCPGKNLYSQLSDGSILSRVKETIRAGAPGLGVLCGPDADQLVADIEAGLV